MKRRSKINENVKGIIYGQFTADSYFSLCSKFSIMSMCYLEKWGKKWNVNQFGSVRNDQMISNWQLTEKLKSYTETHYN